MASDQPTTEQMPERVEQALDYARDLHMQTHIEGVRCNCGYATGEYAIREAVRAALNEAFYRGQRDGESR